MSELPGRLTREITEEERQAYREDGAAVIRGVVPMGWIELMREAIDRILANPGSASIEYTPEGKEGRYYGDFFVWMRDPDFRAFMMDSPMPELAASLLGSARVNFFYDQLLVKEPKTEEPTPLHQDRPYWPVRGNDIVSVWVPFDPATPESGVVHYVKGSHKWGRFFAPRTFGNSTGYKNQYEGMGLEPIDDVEANLDEYDVITWDMEPGDVIVHNSLTIHYAPGNASPTGRRRGLALRYVGDDAVWDTRPGTFMTNPKVQELLPEIALQDGDRFSGEAFPQVWPRN